MTTTTSEMSNHCSLPSSTAEVPTGAADTTNENNTAFNNDRTTVESWPPIDYLEPRTESESPNEETGETISRCKKCVRYLLAIYHAYDFPIHVMIAILIAYLYPPLGSDYVQPYITANWVAVCYIFAIFGMSVRTEDFIPALSKVRFNAFIQIYNFGYISAVVFGVTRLLALANILDQTLANGMAICACLPMSINIGIILTSAAGGDEAVAIFHTGFGNFVGIFLSPALILGYLGTTGYIDIGQIYQRLSLIVILPLITGQLVQRFIHPVRDFFFQYKRVFKKSSEWALLFIVFTIFSARFAKKTKGNLGQIFIMIFIQFCLLTGFMTTMWWCLKFLYPNQPKLRVAGTFISVQKTISLGIPLITSIYLGDPNLATYTLPILIWHPMQLIIGSSIVPWMVRFLERETDRLAQKDGTVDEGKIGDVVEDVEAPQLEEGNNNNGDDNNDDDLDVVDLDDDVLTPKRGDIDSSVTTSTTESSERLTL